MPATALDPHVGGDVAGGERHHVDHVLPGVGLVQREDHLGPAQTEEVAVGFHEPGNGQPPGQIDHLGGRADVPGDVAVAADGDDGVTGNGNRFGVGRRLVDGDQRPVHEYQVGRVHIGATCREGSN